MEEIALGEIIHILSRRRKYFLGVFCLLLAILSYFVLGWSNYRSTATVQIAQPDIDSSAINPNAAFVTLEDQRINQVQQKVTSLESLSQIIKKFNLYPGSIDSVPIAVLTDRMRSKIKVDLISGNISNPAAAQKQTAEQLSAIAFNLSFDYSDPQLTQQVADELVTRFLDEDLKQRRTQAEDTSAFLAAQITALESSMADQEKAIAEFRAKNGESGPAALMFNQQAIANLNMTIENVEAQITSNEGTQGALRTQLAMVDPYSRVIADGQLLTTPAVQLKALETQYTALTSQYGPDHPDVLKLRRQIKGLKAQIGPSEKKASLEAQIADVRTNLAAAKSTKGADHPDVVALEKELKKLEASKPADAAATDNATSDDNIKHDADNPAYLQLSSQLMTAESQHKSLVAQHDELVAQKTKYEQFITSNPTIEQEMAKLTRDYDNAQLRYRELKEKKMAADMNAQLEQGRKGHRLVVTNPPEVPENTQPRRSLLFLGAMVVSVIGGLGAVFVVEASSQSIHGASHLAALMGAAPLVAIPYLMSEEEKHIIMSSSSRIMKMGRIVKTFVWSMGGPVMVRASILRRRLPKWRR